MIEFSIILIPTLILAAPILSLLLFFIPKAREPARFEKKITISLFVFNFLISLLGMLRFQNEFRVGFVIPFSLDGSGFFDFSLYLFWSRFIWIMVTSACLIALSVYDGEKQFLGENKKLRFYFLAGVSLFSSLAYLSENILLSILFLEVTLFFFHADGLISGADEAIQERDAFFRRALFVVVGLLATFALSCFSFFEPKGIILICGLIYISALIFSRHNFTEWSSLPISTAKMAASLFLLNKIMKSDLAPSSWLFIAGAFGVVSAFFSLFSFLSNKTRESSFWLLFSCFTYLLFLRFYSGIPQANFWSAYESIGLLAAFSLSIIVRYAGFLKGPSSKAAAIVASLFLLLLISGVFPGLEEASKELERKNTVLDFVAMAIVTFLLAATVGKASIFPAKKDGASADEHFYPIWITALLLLILQICAVAFYLNLSSINFDTYAEAFARPEVQLRLGALLLAITTGILSGGLIGVNGRFRTWIERRNTSLPEFLPSLGSTTVDWSEKITMGPQRLVSWVLEVLARRGSGFSSALEKTDYFVFATRLQGHLAEYSINLSKFVRRAHVGNARIYFLVGVALALFGSIIFIVGGK